LSVIYYFISGTPFEDGRSDPPLWNKPRFLPLAAAMIEEASRAMGYMKNQPNEITERKRKRDKENHEIGMSEILP
jgi:hypothetical protein